MAMTATPTADPDILPPPHARAPLPRPAKPAQRHPFTDLVPGRIVHYVMRSGECRGAFVVHVQRSKGELVQIGEELDETGGPESPILRQAWTLPDSGACTLDVMTHRAFDIEDVYPEPAGGLWQRDAVRYAAVSEWEEDSEAGTWHWLGCRDLRSP